MEELTASFESLDWETGTKGLREKKLVVGSATLRLLELTGEFEHPDWCLKGHIGYVVEGSFVLDIDGEEFKLGKTSVFAVKDDEPAHRHIPKVGNSGRVLLLLIEE